MQLPGRYKHGRTYSTGTGTSRTWTGTLPAGRAGSGRLYERP